MYLKNFDSCGVAGIITSRKGNLITSFDLKSVSIVDQNESKIKYTIDKKIIKHSRCYGVCSIPVQFNAHKVKIEGSEDVIVYRSKSGWIVDIGDRTIGKEKKGMGWIGFDTPEEAVENYLKTK